MRPPMRASCPSRGGGGRVLVQHHGTGIDVVLLICTIQMWSPAVGPIPDRMIRVNCARQRCLCSSSIDRTVATAAIVNSRD